MKNDSIRTVSLWQEHTIFVPLWQGLARCRNLNYSWPTLIQEKSNAKRCQRHGLQKPRQETSAFFEQSRDQWKAKHRIAKASVKRLKNRVRFLDQSKEHWKSRAQELEREIARLKASAQALAQAVETLEKESPHQ